MVEFEYNASQGKWEATDRVPNFPTRESYLAPFEGTNLRPPDVEIDPGGEVEDLDLQDHTLVTNGMKSWSPGGSHGS